MPKSSGGFRRRRRCYLMLIVANFVIAIRKPTGAYFTENLGENLRFSFAGFFIRYAIIDGDGFFLNQSFRFEIAHCPLSSPPPLQRLRQRFHFGAARYHSISEGASPSRGFTASRRMLRAPMTARCACLHWRLSPIRSLHFSCWLYVHLIEQSMPLISPDARRSGCSPIIAIKRHHYDDRNNVVIKAAKSARSIAFLMIKYGRGPPII